MRQKLYQHMAGTIDAYKRCKADASKADWADRHMRALEIIAADCLPRGSGIDCGTDIDVDASTIDRIVLTFEFHHMDDNGMYAGWTSHKAIITASLIGDIDIRITGRDRNGIKDYLSDVYYWDLRAQFDHGWDAKYEKPTYTRVPEVPAVIVAPDDQAEV